MKTVIASIVLFGFVMIEADAQTAAGNFLIGGTGGISRSKSHVATGISTLGPSTTFTITPTVGYFAVTNFMVGVQGNYLHNWMNQSGVKGRTNSFTIGPIFRYYVPFGGKFAVFPEATAAYYKTVSKSNGEIDGTIIDDKYKTIYYIYRAGAGITWFVRPNIGVEAVLGYRQTNQKSTSSFSSLMYTNFALQFYFSRQ